MSSVNENWSALFGGASAKRFTSWRSCRGAGFLLANGAARELPKILRRWHRTPSLAYVDNYRVVLPTGSNIVGLMALPSVTSSLPVPVCCRPNVRSLSGTARASRKTNNQLLRHDEQPRHCQVRTSQLSANCIDRRTIPAAAIAKELSVVYGDGHTPNWILDLSVTSLFSILSAVGQGHQTIEVFCDESKPLLVNREIFDKMVDRPDMPTRMHFWDNRPFGFNLSVEPKFVDSKTHPGIQIADVIAATANYCMQHRTEPHSQRWFGMLKESLSDCSILPDLDYADLQQRDGFVGAMILRELLDRSLRKADLFDGMPEFIACARESFPMWLQREFAFLNERSSN